MMESKFCTKCSTLKKIEHFYNDKNRKDGKYPTCKSCLVIYNQSRKIEKANYDKEYNIQNANKKREQKRAYREKNKEYLYKKRIERIESGKETIIEKLAARLRSRLYKVTHGQKSGSAIKDLGCSIDELKKYIESKFLPGMNWDNYGKEFGKWHIDHIIPLSSFDLYDRKQLLIACNYTNLQPLWAEDNLRKSNKVV